MNWFTGIIVYVLVWWVTLFAILPLWVVPAERGGIGHAAGAPKRPLLVRKDYRDLACLGGHLDRHLSCGALALAELPRILK
jgi:predicted secreted protein